MKLALLACLLFVSSGCGWVPMAAKELVTEGSFIRTMVVKDDWVLVKNDKALYRRYIPGRGFSILRINHGNVALLNAVKATKTPGLIANHTPFDGKITRSNKDIKVFGTYKKAVESGEEFMVSRESVKYIPTPKETPAWWVKRRLEKEWKP